MRLLLLNTCWSEASAALADSLLTMPIVAQHKMPGRTASEQMVAAVREMLTVAKWRLSDLSAIAVVTGPGSFTGVRVGLSVAKGLSEASGVPVIAISGLALLASAVEPDQKSGLGRHQGRVCALLDAGRGEFYCGEFHGAEACGERLISRDSAAEAVGLADRTAVCEDAVFQAFKDVRGVHLVAEPMAADALPLAAGRLADRNFDDPMMLDANYLRRTDAEIFAKPAVTPAG